MNFSDKGTIISLLNDGEIKEGRAFDLLENKLNNSGIVDNIQKNINTIIIIIYMIIYHIR